ncbi:hypothetical protein PGTUg99_025893 [Puccinia graminis f. sp. tritici]|uniref:Uncharacterized protein n=1 Tax=Puccinia graminis f. sp. tritici TaxID=56615 RepID=A0A5B0RG10_PUCGR|nr:hypothetical protein PGTUg99_025893 [Puccinia graminis f. sp. tritici]
MGYLYLLIMIHLFQVGITAVFQDSFTCSANKNDAKPWKCCDDTTFAIGTVRYDITESLKYCQTATPV